MRDQQQYFFDDLLPFMQNLALKFPTHFPNGIPLLVPQQTATIKISREQSACLVALCFFCVFERIGPIRFPGAHFPDFYCSSLVSWPKNTEKYECLLHYFDRFMQESK